MQQIAEAAHVTKGSPFYHFARRGQGSSFRPGVRAPDEHRSDGIESRSGRGSRSGDTPDERFHAGTPTRAYQSGLDRRAFFFSLLIETLHPLHMTNQIPHSADAIRELATDTDDRSHSGGLVGSAKATTQQSSTALLHPGGEVL